MIIGHIGVALGARRRWPAIPLAALLAATFAPDILRVVLEAFMHPVTDANVYSHALPWSLLLIAGVGLVALAATRSRSVAGVLMAVVLSHIALDVVSGTKPIWVGGPHGFYFQLYAPFELVLESVIAIAGWLSLRAGADGRRWVAARWVPVFLVLLEAVYLAGSISQRGYASRCVAFPTRPCTDSSWLTQRWNVERFWD